MALILCSIAELGRGVHQLPTFITVLAPHQGSGITKEGFIQISSRYVAIVLWLLRVKLAGSLTREVILHTGECSQ
jgi:hypothetical protein